MSLVNLEDGRKRATVDIFAEQGKGYPLRFKQRVGGDLRIVGCNDVECDINDVKSKAKHSPDGFSLPLQNNKYEEK